MTTTTTTTIYQLKKKIESALANMADARPARKDWVLRNMIVAYLRQWPNKYDDPGAIVHVASLLNRRRGFTTLLCDECGLPSTSLVSSRLSICYLCRELLYDEDGYHIDNERDNSTPTSEMHAWNFSTDDRFVPRMTKAEGRIFGASKTRAPMFYGVEMEAELRSISDDDIERVVSSTNLPIPLDTNAATYTRGSRNQRFVVSQIKRVMQDSIGETAVVVFDGSLSHGVEIVSAPATLAAHKAGMWDGLFAGKDAPAQWLKAWTTHTCGMHIHASRNAFTPLVLGKLVVFLNRSENVEFIKKFAGRFNNHFCQQIRDIKTAHVLPKYSSHGNIFEKFRTVNMMPSNTIEFRLFKGNTTKHGLYRNIEFLDALRIFASTHSMKEMNHKDFCQWVTKLPNSLKDYNNLMHRLVSLKFVAVQHLKHVPKPSI